MEGSHGPMASRYSGSHVASIHSQRSQQYSRRNRLGIRRIMPTTTNTFGSNGRNRLLAALQPADFSLLTPNLKDISLTQGDVLQEAGEAIKYVYFPQSGMISLLTVMQNGSAVETATVGREGATGAMSGLGSRIPIARGTGVVLPADAISCLGAFRPPAAGARG